METLVTAIRLHDITTHKTTIGYIFMKLINFKINAVMQNSKENIRKRNCIQISSNFSILVGL